MENAVTYGRGDRPEQGQRPKPRASANAQVQGEGKGQKVSWAALGRSWGTFGLFGSFLVALGSLLAALGRFVAALEPRGGDLRRLSCVTSVSSGWMMNSVSVAT